MQIGGTWASHGVGKVAYGASLNGGFVCKVGTNNRLQHASEPARDVGGAWETCPSQGNPGQHVAGAGRAFRLFGHAGHSEVSLCGPAEAQLAGRTVAGRFLRTTARIGALSSAKLVSIVSRPHSRRLMLFLSPYGVINATCGSTITGLKQQRW